MLFNSYSFFLFFPIVTVLFFLLPHRLRWLHLLVASFIFYMAFLPVYVLILLVTIVVDYFAGIAIENAVGFRRKIYLIASIVANVGFLAIFKYWDFIVVNLNELLHLHLPLLKKLWLSSWIIHSNNALNTSLNAHFGTQYRILEDIVLPIGLSFHTFQAMSYTIEVYRGAQKPERHFGIYALYVMFYPQLVAGPIERPQNMLHQFHERKYFSAENLIVGLRLIAWGLFKKVVIADRLAQYVNPVYAHPENYHWLNLVIATIFFSIQIYCDFSGYSDMAIGAARVMGYHLMINFKRPYFATNIRDFWGRWHVSLSSWFRDYVYIPLGGNRVQFYRYLTITALVFLISGFWHGASWTFIIWGALHAVYFVTYIIWTRIVKTRIHRSHPFLRFSGWLLTMICVGAAWVYFRADNVAIGNKIVSQIMTLATPDRFHVLVAYGNADDGSFGLFSLIVLAILLPFLFIIEYRHQPLLTEFNASVTRDTIFLGLVTFLIISFGVFSETRFIYFQF